MWLPVLSAVLGIVAFLPFNLYPAAFAFLVPLFVFLMREKKLWRLVLGAIIFRLIFGIGTAYYTLEPIFWSSSLLIFLGLPIAIFLFKKLMDTTCPSILPTLIFLPFAWTFFDLAQAQWSLLPTFIITAGNALGSSPFLGLAGIGGFFALTFFTALINALLAALFLLAWQSVKHRVFDTCVLTLGISVIVLLFSGWQISQYELRSNASAYAALPNEISFAAISVDGTIDAGQFERIKREMSDRRVDLIVFPENMFNRHAPSDGAEFRDLARELRTPVLAAYATASGTERYKSAVVFGADGAVAGVHNKNRLTFIGEYWPFGNWRPSFYEWLRERDPRIGTYAVFTPGNASLPGERNLLSTAVRGDAVLFAAPICLEIHYPTDLEAYRAQGARFIVNQSGNRWISSGLEHFSYLTTNLKKIESVSLQIPIISSSVNDFAGVTLPNGESVQHPVLDTGRGYTVFFGTVRY
ncbi:MAG: nitrilase-related carbon-nitrogen hydrolase [Candidatus Paceibacterota bacterium]|jgi:apolipoprotein N-acyltransferase